MSKHHADLSAAGLKRGRSGDADGWLRKKREEEEAYRKIAREAREAAPPSRKAVLLHLIDSTSSMQEVMDKTRTTVGRIFGAMMGLLEEDCLFCGGVCYRDPVNCADDVHSSLEIGPYRKWNELMEMERATGGGDYAEDIAGGLLCLTAVLEKFFETQRELGDFNMVLIHATDATTHGHSYGMHDEHNSDEERARFDDAYDGFLRLVRRRAAFFDLQYLNCGKNDAVEQLFARMTLGFELVFDDPSAGRMTRLDPELAFEGDVTVDSCVSSLRTDTARSLAEPSDGAAALATALRTLAGVAHTVTETVREEGLSYATDARFRGVEVIQPSMPPISERATVLEKILVYASGKSETEEGHLVNERDLACSFRADPPAAAPPPYDTSVHDSNVVLRMARAAFGKGSERICYEAELLKLDSSAERFAREAATLKRADMNDMLAEAKAYQRPSFGEVVVKVPIVGNPDLKGTMLASIVARHFSERLNAFTSAVPESDKRLPQVEFVVPSMLSFESVDRIMPSGLPVLCGVTTNDLADKYALCEPLLRGTYTKYVNNDASRAPLMSPDSDTYQTRECVLDMLVLYSAVLTRGHYAMTDLQGVFSIGSNSFHLTDVGASSTLRRSFVVATNQGRQGVVLMAYRSVRALRKAAPSLLEALRLELKQPADCFTKIEEQGKALEGGD